MIVDLSKPQQGQGRQQSKNMMLANDTNTNNGTSSNSHSKSPRDGATANRVNKRLLLLVFLMLAFNVYQQTRSAILSSAHYYDDSDDGFLDGGIEYARGRKRERGGEQLDNDNNDDDDDEADVIVRRSYEKSYAHILSCEKDNLTEKACMKKTLDYFNTANNANANDPGSNNNSTSTSSSIPSIPWWFQTLLRDTQTNGAYGFWHHFQTTQPPMHFCAIGKIATTEWRRVFCKLNANECQPNPIEKCGKRQCRWITKETMPEDAPRAVFLRDPLERLLSGYLDKCYKMNVRRNEKHCEPNVVFNMPKGLGEENRDGKQKKEYPSLLDGLEGKDKLMFAAYVDVLPLKWNVHFVPQAIACDLYRNLDQYDFVGKMGTDFMYDLQRMATQFGNQLPEVLNSSFGYMEHVQSGKKNFGRDANHHATHAPAKVAQFYTAQTVRRGLELLSIDYVLLGLEVPEWARQMLRDDVA